MSRVTVIQNGRSFRCPADQARTLIINGAKLDTTDERGVAAFERFTESRPLPTKRARKAKE